MVELGCSLFIHCRALPANWQRHFGTEAGREIGYCHIEKLHNLESLPPDGFSVVCFPVKVRGASAGWTRAVAILGE
jgi:hypothetical protein